jgi:Calcineurin-like phosphoesterase
MGRTHNTIRIDTIKKYLADPEFRKMPNLKLARIIYKDHPAIFVYAKNRGEKHAIDCVRSIVRSCKGKRGSFDIRKTDEFKEFYQAEDNPRNPYNLPKSDEMEFLPFILHKHKRIAILNDIHVPYHSMKALTAVIAFLIKDNPDALLINGDFWDFYQLSRFDRDPRKRGFGSELELGCQIIRIFQEFLKCKIYIKFGNHEERYDHFLFMKARELVGVEEFSLEELIRRRLPDVDFIKDKRIMA